MATITYVADDGTQTTVRGRNGDSVMQTSLAHGIDGILAECGGSMMCATCHVYVDEAFLDRLPVRSDAEEEMLECAASERRDNSRLSCQIVVAAEIDGIVVRLPEAQ